MLPLAVTVALAVSGLSAQGGHTVSYALKESELVYDVTGRVLTNYIGGISAPDMRQAEFKGQYVVKTEKQGEEWRVTGLARNVTGTSRGKAMSTPENKLASHGRWTVPIGDVPFYTINGEPMPPSQLNAPFWPLAWMPIVPEKSLKIGEEFFIPFDFPLQAFLEDDPIGGLPIAVRLVFNGPEQMPYGPVWSFSIQQEETIDHPVRHPEDPGLSLKGRILLNGRLRISREDGRLQSSSVILNVDLTLEGEGYPFGFSKSKGSVTSSFERVR